MKDTDKWKEAVDSDNLSDDEKMVLDAMGLNGSSRRKFLKQVSAASLSIYASSFFTSDLFASTMKDLPENTTALLNEVKVNLRVNDMVKPLTLDSRTPLLDALRERLALTGTKKRM